MSDENENNDEFIVDELIIEPEEEGEDVKNHLIFFLILILIKIAL